MKSNFFLLSEIIYLLFRIPVYETIMVKSFGGKPEYDDHITGGVGVSKLSKGGGQKKKL